MAEPTTCPECGRMLVHMETCSKYPLPRHLHRRPYVGEGIDGALRSAEIDRSEADGMDHGAIRDACLASAVRWEQQAAVLAADADAAFGVNDAPIGTTWVTPDGTMYRLRGHGTDWLADWAKGEEVPTVPDFSVSYPTGGFSNARALPDDARLVWAPSEEQPDG